MWVDTCGYCNILQRNSLGQNEQHYPRSVRATWIASLPPPPMREMGADKLPLGIHLEKHSGFVSIGATSQEWVPFLGSFPAVDF